MGRESKRLGDEIWGKESPLVMIGQAIRPCNKPPEYPFNAPLSSDSSVSFEPLGPQEFPMPFPP